MAARPAYKPEMLVPNEYTDLGLISVSSDIIKWAEETFLSHEVTEHTDEDRAEFWTRVNSAYAALLPRNLELLRERPRFVDVSNAHHKERRLAGLAPDPDAYIKDLRKAGLVAEDLEPFRTAGKTIRQNPIDPRASIEAGPELVGPLTKFDMVTHAMHAWQDLRTHIYNSDIPEGMHPETKDLIVASKEGINGDRLRVVDDIISDHLSKHLKLPSTYMWSDICDWQVEQKDGKYELLLDARLRLHPLPLDNPDQFLGFEGPAEKPDAVYVRLGDIVTKLVIKDGEVKVASIKGITRWLADLEDATSVVTSKANGEEGATDYIAALDNWWHINRGTLVKKLFGKAEKDMNQRKAIERAENLKAGITIMGAEGKPITLSGTPLIAVRRAGIHVMDYAVVDSKTGEALPRGLLDTILIAAIGRLNTIAELNNDFHTSEDGRIHINFPKLRGTDEIAFALENLRMAEKVNRLPHGTLSFGLMHEEAPTMVNLSAGLLTLKDVINYLNDGFLDLSASIIHANMEAGIFMPMNDIKASPMNGAHNRNTVDAGLRGGFKDHGVLGGGMWELIRKMFLMVQQKGDMYSKTGFLNSWYPTPQGAAIGAFFNFVEHDPHKCQDYLESTLDDRSPEDLLREMATLPLMKKGDLTDAQIDAALLDYLQDMVGYADRWIKLGVGASGIPDINGDDRMKDFATLRFASLLTGNWMYHGLVTPERVMRILKQATTKVKGFESWAMPTRAACSMTRPSRR